MDKRTFYIVLSVIVIIFGCMAFARFTWTDTWNRFLIKISTTPSQREADVPVAKEEFSRLIEKVLSFNPDPAISVRVYESLHALGGNYSYCIRGTTGFVFRVNRPLEEVAAGYARSFETGFRESVINPERIYYEVVIDEKNELLIVPVDASDFDPLLFSTPPPDICRAPGLCYEVQVFYADPSNSLCRGG